MIEKTFPITETLLSNALKSSQKLLELLNVESDTLRQRMDAAALTRIAGDKRQVIAQLEQFTQQLSQVLATEKLVVNHDNIQAYFGKADAIGLSSQNARSQWANITALSQKCRILNEQNGASIDLVNRHTQRAIQILRGKSPLGTTYGRDGSTRSERFSHTLVSV